MLLMAVFLGRFPLLVGLKGKPPNTSLHVDMLASATEEKKLSICVFQFPPDKGNVGTAAYLDVFGSIHAVMKEGYFDATDLDHLAGFQGRANEQGYRFFTKQRGNKQTGRVSMRTRPKIASLQMTCDLLPEPVT